jgi:hypothetical protein
MIPKITIKIDELDWNQILHLIDYYLSCVLEYADDKEKIICINLIKISQKYKNLVIGRKSKSLRMEMEHALSLVQCIYFVEPFQAPLAYRVGGEIKRQLINISFSSIVIF